MQMLWNWINWKLDQGRALVKSVGANDILEMLWYRNSNFDTYRNDIIGISRYRYIITISVQ